MTGNPAQGAYVVDTFAAVPPGASCSFIAGLKVVNWYPGGQRLVEAARHGVHVDYRLYLHTAWWKKTRRRALALSGQRCQVTVTGRGRCPNRSRLQVHHRHYDTLGAENPATDLVVVCPKHHRLIHAVAVR
jgi:hypothetical protein